jgi:photosystem II stability/assembly factor-like uncharacterized protein
MKNIYPATAQSHTIILFAALIALIFGQLESGNAQPVSASNTEILFFENGEQTLSEREYKIWGPRIYGSGGFTGAAEAMTRYVTEFNSSSASASSQSKWTQLGPVGNTTNTPTVGQIHRITFHPRYGNEGNRIVWAASGFGGLWKSNDGGSSWSNMGTDNALPFCGIADVAANKAFVYAATGYPDGSIYNSYQPNVSAVNPLFTQGVYRTNNDGVSWSPVNNGLLEHFSSGGVIRRMLATTDDRLLIASSQGIFICANSAGAEPLWKKGLLNNKPILDQQLRGLETKPGNPETVYAAGSDIYVSKDGGSTWQQMTGEGTGLSMKSLYENYDKFLPDRINLAVTHLNKNLLYAYIMGHHEGDNSTRMFLFRYDGTKWKQILTHKTQSNFDLYSQSYMAIAVSPENQNVVYWGNTVIHRTEITESRESETMQFMGYMTNNGGYVDIHSIVFEPDASEPRMFVANHGGVSIYSFAQSKWSYSNTGICNATIWSFDDNETDPDQIIIALQDHGIRTRQRDSSGYQWRMLNTGGDGYSARIYDDVRGMAYHSNSWRTLNEYDFNTKRNNSVARGFPKDIPDPGSSPDIFFTNSFSCINHPISREPYLTFSEIYRRTPETGTKNISWSLESDIGKTIQGKWQRQLTELAISFSNPNVIYAVTMGVDNGSNPAEKWHLDPRVFKSTTGFSDGDWSKNHFFEVQLTNPSSGIPVLNGNVKLPPVTGIVVAPDNPNKVWITFTGYSRAHKVYRSDDGGKTWINEDPQGTLNNLPVNGIVYQNGTNDRIFIATDAGVYFKDKNSNWSEYGDLPNVRVNEIRINSCNNTIKAATFGRGVFEASLPEAIEPSAMLCISDHVIWEKDMVVTSSIRIAPGGSLTIKKKLMMPEGGKIVIEKKGKLIVDGGLITNACEQWWEGIVKVTSKSSAVFQNGGKTAFTTKEN